MGSRLDLEANLASALTYKLRLLHKQVERIGEVAYVRGTGLPMSEGRCLATVGAFGPLSVRELAQRSNLHGAQASRATQALLNKGLVSKAVSRADARELRIALTDEGRAVWQAVMEVIGRHNEEIFGGLTAAERLCLGPILDKLIVATVR